ncbi:hypothetical protein B0T20DRAFT_392357 [Sordaria brevicollis]|uniref:Uncharacterized protein n=1 Tax=Sordaria brevicollis TaxID=83679 RepID=A0AAE0PGI5_SORBR|nr:hypothetical protein B0T20DRAFT_392357 [Sordaria brevicollis]
MPPPSSPVNRNPRRSQAPEGQRQPPRLYREDAIIASGEEPEPAAPPNQEHRGPEHVLELPDTPGTRNLIRLFTRTRPDVWRREHIVWVPRAEFYQRRRTLDTSPQSNEQRQEPSPKAKQAEQPSNTPSSRCPKPSRPSNEQGPDVTPATSHDEQPLSTSNPRQKPSSPPPPYVAKRAPGLPATSHTEQPISAAPGPVRPIELPDSVGINVFVHQISLTDPNHPFASAVWVAPEVFWQRGGTAAPKYSALPGEGEVTVELALPKPEYTTRRLEEEWGGLGDDVQAIDAKDQVKTWAAAKQIATGLRLLDRADLVAHSADDLVAFADGVLHPAFKPVMDLVQELASKAEELVASFDGDMIHDDMFQ